MRLKHRVKMGIGIEWEDWAPMRCGSYAIGQSYALWTPVCAFGRAEEAGIIFG